MMRNLSLTTRWNALLLIVLVSLLCVSLPAAHAGTASRDTLHTNLWLTESLFEDLLRVGMDSLPADGDAVLLTPIGNHPALDLMRTIAVDLVEESGRAAILLDDGEEEENDSVEMIDLSSDMVRYEIRFRVEDVRLTYPDAGRRLGLWRTWVDRDLEVSGIVTVRDRRSGRILADERVVKNFGDRLPASRVSELESQAYEFTEAAIEDGGISAVLEEVVVLGALAGMVVAYFATTSN
jgi:hypothetical protein